MGTVAQWGDILFEITAESALLMKELKITAESETEDAEQNKQGYVQHKKGKAAQVDFTLEILAEFGQDVRAVVTKLLDCAQRGNPEYFYVGGEKVFPAKTMMTKAEASEIEIAPGNKWVRAKVAVTAKQAEAAYIIPNPEAETSSGGGGRSAKKSTKKTDVYMPPEAGYVEAPKKETTAAAAQNTSTFVDAAKKAVSAITQGIITTKKLTTMEKRL